MARRLRRQGDSARDEARLFRVLRWLTVAMVGILLGVLRLYGPVTPRGVEAPAEVFSAARAMQRLRHLAAEGEPHPLGTAAQRRLRERLEASLRELGLEPQVQVQYVCGAMGTCAQVENVVARLGGPGGGALLLVAHYDSTPVSPGANDDLAGVATSLEIVRALSALEGAPPQPVVVLFADGEEAGLLGAEAFRQEHPFARDVGAVVNLDGRGSGGLSTPFQLSGDPAWVLEQVGQDLLAPVVSSAFQAVYPFLPADTDFTVFRRQGIHGADVAMVGNIFDYHTARDRLETVEPGTVQSLGDTGLALVRALAGAPPPPRGGRRPAAHTFFDVLRQRVVSWPPWGGYLMAALSGLSLVGMARELERREHLEAKALWEEFVWILATLLAAAAVALVANQLLRLAGVLPGPWVAHPHPLLLCFLLLGVACACLSTARSWRWGGFWETWIGVWTFWTLGGVVAELVLPGTGYLLQVPALLASLGGVLTLWLPDPDTYPVTVFVVTLPALVVAVLWFPPMRLLFLISGFALRIPYTLAAAFLLTPLVPLLAVQERGQRVAMGVGAGVLAVALGFLCLFLPVYDEFAPQPLQMTFHQDARGEGARWLASGLWGPLPWPMREAGGFGTHSTRPFPWTRRWFPSYEAPAPRLDLEAPEFEVLATSREAGERRIQGILRSHRDVARCGLGLGPGAEVVTARVDGRKVFLDREERPHETGGWRFFSRWRPPRREVEFEIVLKGEDPVPAFFYDRTLGLPSSGRAIMEARPNTVTPFQDGEGTLLSREGEL